MASEAIQLCVKFVHKLRENIKYVEKLKQKWFFLLQAYYNKFELYICYLFVGDL